MKKVLFILGACALLCAVVVSGGGFLSLHTDKTPKERVAKLEAEGVPNKATDLLPEPDRTVATAPVTEQAVRPSAPPQRPQHSSCSTRTIPS